MCVCVFVCEKCKHFVAPHRDSLWRKLTCVTRPRPLSSHICTPPSHLASMVCIVFFVILASLFLSVSVTVTVTLCLCLSLSLYLDILFICMLCLSVCRYFVYLCLSLPLIPKFLLLNYRAGSSDQLGLLDQLDSLGGGGVRGSCGCSRCERWPYQRWGFVTVGRSFLSLSPSPLTSFFLFSLFSLSLPSILLGFLFFSILMSFVVIQLSLF